MIWYDVYVYIDIDYILFIIQEEGFRFRLFAYGTALFWRFMNRDDQ